MNATEQIAIGNNEESEFYDLLWDEMDRHYATYPPAPIIQEPEPEPDYHNNPAID